MTWKLPEHLEPYRGLIATGGMDIKKFPSVEDSRKENPLPIMIQVTLLQRLYGAGKLK